MCDSFLQVENTRVEKYYYDSLLKTIMKENFVLEKSSKI